MDERIKKFVKAIDAVTATTTSSPIPVAGAKKVTLFLKRADHSSGSTTFTVTGTLDDDRTNGAYVQLNNLVTDAANTNVQDYIRVASVALSSNTSAHYSLDLTHIAMNFIKVVATEATDGTHTAYVLVEF